MHIHTIHTCRLRADFFSFQGEYICVSERAFPPPVKLAHLLPQSVHQSFCLLLTLINPDRQNSPLPQRTFFPFCLFILPSYLTSTLTLSLFICLSSSHPCCSSTLTPCQRGDTEEIIVFLSHRFSTAGSSFLNGSIKMELRAGLESQISNNSFHVVYFM